MTPQVAVVAMKRHHSEAVALNFHDSKYKAIERRRGSSVSECVSNVDMQETLSSNFSYSWDDKGWGQTHVGTTPLLTERGQSRRPGHKEPKREKRRQAMAIGPQDSPVGNETPPITPSRSDRGVTQNEDRCHTSPSRTIKDVLIQVLMDVDWGMVASENFHNFFGILTQNIDNDLPFLPRPECPMLPGPLPGPGPGHGHRL